MEHARLKRVMREIAACEKEADDEIAVKMIDGAQMCIRDRYPTVLQTLVLFLKEP